MIPAAGSTPMTVTSKRVSRSPSDPTQRPALAERRHLQYGSAPARRPRLAHAAAGAGGRQCRGTGQLGEGGSTRG
eukprot:233285-Hanusia_phi.AAC.3